MKKGRKNVLIRNTRRNTERKRHARLIVDDQWRDPRELQGRFFAGRTIVFAIRSAFRQISGNR